MFDKYNALPKSSNSNDEYYWVKKPTQVIFRATCNEFWCSKRVVVARNSICYGYYECKYKALAYKNALLVYGININFSCSGGNGGKYLEKLLLRDIRGKYLESYSSAEILSI